ELGAWTDEAHLSAEDVDELRQFVQLEAAEDRPHGTDPGIGPDGNAVLSAPLGPHRPELPQSEGAEASPDALLLEEDWAGRIELDQDGDHAQERQAHDEADYASHHIDDALEHGPALRHRLKRLAMSRTASTTRSTSAGFMLGYSGRDTHRAKNHSATSK